MDAKTVIKKLGLVPLPEEGGWYRETYRSEEIIARSALPDRYSSDKSYSTAIYYLLTSDDISALHRVTSEEIFHFYTGDPIEMLLVYPDGSHQLITLGNNIEAGEVPQVIVPRGVWQGCRVKQGGEWALMGTTVAPAFDFEDFELGMREELVQLYPQCETLIRQFTRDI